MHSSEPRHLALSACIFSQKWSHCRLPLSYAWWYRLFLNRCCLNMSICTIPIKRLVTSIAIVYHIRCWTILLNPRKLHCFIIRIYSIAFDQATSGRGNDEKSYRINYGDVQATENDACHYGSSAELVSTHWSDRTLCSTKDDSLFFYNCSMGWFGPQCQFTFDTSASFSAIVKSAFQNRSVSGNDLEDPDYTCYTHLRCKYGGSGFACLDWREVCDGKIDCPDGGND